MNRQRLKQICSTAGVRSLRNAASDLGRLYRVHNRRTLVDVQPVPKLLRHKLDIAWENVTASTTFTPERNRHRLVRRERRLQVGGLESQRVGQTFESPASWWAHPGHTQFPFATIRQYECL